MLLVVLVVCWLRFKKRRDKANIVPLDATTTNVSVTSNYAPMPSVASMQPEPVYDSSALRIMNDDAVQGDQYPSVASSSVSASPYQYQSVDVLRNGNSSAGSSNFYHDLQLTKQ